MEEHFIMKKHLSLLFIALFFIVTTQGCKESVKRDSPKKTKGDKVVWASHEDKPGWLFEEPDADEKYFYFVGISRKQATEQLSRDDAYDHAIKGVVKYLGSFMQEKIEKVVVSYGLSSEIADPTAAKRNFEEQLSGGLASRLKAKSWYIERWENSLGEQYYLTRVKARIPTATLNGTYEDSIDAQVEDLKKKRDAANDVKAKAQFEKAMDAFGKAKESGLSFD